MKSLFNLACKIADRLLPKRSALWLRYRYRLRYGEAELAWVKRLCNSQEVFIDVGAAEGLYAFAARNHVRLLSLFEPNSVTREALKQTFPEAQLFDCALSSEAGIIELRTPVVQGIAYHGFATIEEKNTLDLDGKETEQRLKISRRRLDELVEEDQIPGRVCLIKVDVEGHELQVLEGASDLLDRDAPALIIESERRHNQAMPFALFEYLQTKGYSGFYLYQGQLRPLADFTLALQPDGQADSLVRNFIFAKRPEQLEKLT